MIALDLVAVLALMGLLFLRQIVIFKQPNKINYAPLLLGIGAIGTVLHLLINPDPDDMGLLFRESLIPLFTGLILFIVMNVLSQTRQRDMLITQQRLAAELSEQFAQIKHYIVGLESRIASLDSNEEMTREEVRRIFQDDINALNAIQENQKQFTKKFEALTAQQHETLQHIETFTKKELPELDNVVHRHIDMLRIAEQDHFNRVKSALEGAKENRTDIANDLNAIKRGIEMLRGAHHETAQHIVAATESRLEALFADAHRQIDKMRLLSEGIVTTLVEDESLFSNIREQSEVLMKQVLLSAQQLENMTDEAQRITALIKPLNDLHDKLADVHSDYVASKLKLDALAGSLQNAEAVQLDRLRDEIDQLSATIAEEVDASLKKLHEHYHIAQKDISNTVQELSARARLQKSYPRDNPNA